MLVDKGTPKESLLRVPVEMKVNDRTAENYCFRFRFFIVRSFVRCYNGLFGVRRTLVERRRLTVFYRRLTVN